MKRIVFLFVALVTVVSYAAETYLEDGYSQTVYQGTWCGGALKVYFRKSRDGPTVFLGNWYPSTGKAIWGSNSTNITLDSSVVYKYNEYVAVGYSIPHSYTYKIGRVAEGAFQTFDFGKPTTVTVPNSIESYVIPTTMFNNCKNLVALRIYKNMNLSHEFFNGIVDLKEIYVDSANAYNTSYDGLLYNKEKTKLLCCPEGRTGAVSLPTGVTEIGEGAFVDSLITSVEIPDSVTEIGWSAFGNCINLKTVKLPPRINRIHPWTFQGTAIEELVIPDGVADIGWYAFRYCDKLRQIVMPESLESLDIEALQGATNVTVFFKGGVPKAIPQFGVDKFDKISGVYSAKHAAEWRSVVTDGKWKNMSMRQLEATVTFNLGEQGSRIGGGLLTQTVENFDDAAEEPQIEVAFGWRFIGWDKSFDHVQGDVVVNALYEQLICAVPIITPADGTVCRATSQEVRIFCSTDRATVYYTTNGVTPKTSTAILYEGPFEIDDTTTVKAIAVKDNYQTSNTAIATITFAEPYTLAKGIGAENLEFTVGGNAGWYVCERAEGLSVCNCDIEDNEVCWIKTAVVGPGVVSFRWKASCEDDPDGCTWDHGGFMLDENVVANIDGNTQWTDFEFEIW